MEKNDMAIQTEGEPLTYYLFNSSVDTYTGEILHLKDLMQEK